MFRLNFEYIFNRKQVIRWLQHNTKYYNIWRCFLHTITLQTFCRRKRNKKWNNKENFFFLLLLTWIIFFLLIFPLFCILPPHFFLKEEIKYVTDRTRIMRKYREIRFVVPVVSWRQFQANSGSYFSKGRIRILNTITNTSKFVLTPYAFPCAYTH